MHIVSLSSVNLLLQWSQSDVKRDPNRETGYTWPARGIMGYLPWVIGISLQLWALMRQKWKQMECVFPLLFSVSRETEEKRTEEVNGREVKRARETVLRWIKRLLICLCSTWAQTHQLQLKKTTDGWENKKKEKEKTKKRKRECVCIDSMVGELRWNVIIVFLSNTKVRCKHIQKIRHNRVCVKTYG